MDFITVLAFFVSARTREEAASVRSGVFIGLLKDVPSLFSRYPKVGERDFSQSPSAKKVADGCVYIYRIYISQENHTDYTT